MILVPSCSCLCPIYWSHVLSLEWRCSWSSADRRCSNYIWVSNNLITNWGATYIRDLTVPLSASGGFTYCCPRDHDVSNLQLYMTAGWQQELMELSSIECGVSFSGSGLQLSICASYGFTLQTIYHHICSLVEISVSFYPNSIEITTTKIQHMKPIYHGICTYLYWSDCT